MINGENDQDSMHQGMYTGAESGCGRFVVFDVVVAISVPPLALDVLRSQGLLT